MLIEKEKLVEIINQYCKKEKQNIIDNQEKQINQLQSINKTAELLYFIRKNREFFKYEQINALMLALLLEMFEGFEILIKDSGIGIKKDDLTILIDPRWPIITFEFEGVEKPGGVVNNIIVDKNGEFTPFYKGYKEFIQNQTFSNRLKASKVNVRGHVKGINRLWTTIYGFVGLKNKEDIERFLTEEKRVLEFVEKDKKMTTDYIENQEHIKNEVLKHLSTIKELKAAGWSIQRKVIWIDGKYKYKISSNVTDVEEFEEFRGAQWKI